MKDFDSVYLIIGYEKFSLGVEFNDDLLEAMLLEIRDIYRIFSDGFDFIDITSLIVKRYLLIYIFSTVNINTKKR